MPSSRQIALIDFPCLKNPRRIFAIVSTTSIPTSASKNHGSQRGPSIPGSRLDADHPEKGVLFACRFTGGVTCFERALLISFRRRHDAGAARRARSPAPMSRCCGLTLPTCGRWSRPLARQRRVPQTAAGRRVPIAHSPAEAAIGGRQYQPAPCGRSTATAPITACPPSFTLTCSTRTTCEPPFLRRRRIFHLRGVGASRPLALLAFCARPAFHAFCWVPAFWPGRGPGIADREQGAPSPCPCSKIGLGAPPANLTRLGAHSDDAARPPAGRQ